MEELARRAGVTKPIIYELFGNKDGLFRACLERSAGRLAQQVADAVRAEVEPEARLRAGGSPSCASPPSTAWPGADDGGPLDTAVEVRRSQAALVLELLREMAPGEVDRASWRWWRAP